jgi:hypothetical protein
MQVKKKNKCKSGIAVHWFSFLNTSFSVYFLKISGNTLINTVQEFIKAWVYFLSLFHYRVRRPNLPNFLLFSDGINNPCCNSELMNVLTYLLPLRFEWIRKEGLCFRLYFCSRNKWCRIYLQRDYDNGWFMALIVTHIEICSFAEICLMYVTFHFSDPFVFKRLVVIILRDIS